MCLIAAMASLALGVCVLMAAVQPLLESMVANLVSIVRGPLEQVHRQVDGAAGLLRRAAAAALDAFTPAGAWPGEVIIGGCLYVAAFVVMFLGDTGVLILTFQAMGMESPDLLSPGAALAQATGLDLLTVLAFLATAALYGLVLGDVAGVTHLGIWHRARGTWRKVLTVVAVLGLVGTLALGAVLGAWRMGQLLQADDGQLLQGSVPAVTSLDRLGFFVIGVSLPILLMMGLALAGWALVWPPLLGWLIGVAAVILLLAIFRLVTLMTVQALDFFAGLLILVVRVGAHVGRGAWNWIVSFEPVRKLLHLSSMGGAEGLGAGEHGQQVTMGDRTSTFEDIGGGQELLSVAPPASDGAGPGGRGDFGALW
jgi:hypothetical protein